ncbi:MAG: ATP-dependent Clp protease ATP-binding subunit [Lachnospiraceae bacterium]|jgi:ATP-dependent Clp protease ATP-binding subunit ClpC
MQKKPFTQYAQEVIEAATEAAAELGHVYIGTEHLLIGLADVEGSISQKLLGNQNITAEGIKSLIQKTFSGGQEVIVSEAEGFTPRAGELLDNAGGEAERFGSATVGTEHILIALIKQEDSSAVRILLGMGANRQKLFTEILISMGVDHRKHKEEITGTRSEKRDAESSILKDFTSDLCEEARQGRLDPVIGRQDEIARIVQILSRRTKNNPCLVGEPGVGKTAIVWALARKIVDGEIAGPVSRMRILSLDLPAMVAGTKYRGEFEERVKKILSEVREDGRIILFMDEIHTMIGAGGSEGSIDAANILKPALSRGEISIIGATTMDEYRKYFEKDAALARRFQPVYVEQPSDSEAIKILQGLRTRYEEHHGVVITDKAIESAVNLSTRYINDRFLPDKAIDLIDEASSRVRLDSYMKSPKGTALKKEIAEKKELLEEALIAGDIQRARQIRVDIEILSSKLSGHIRDAKKKKAAERPNVTDSDIADAVSKWTRIPVKKLEQEESEKLLNLEETVHKRVVAQDEAVNAVSRAIRRGRVGMKNPAKPIGSFLFLGPTGVGKTELSKALAEALFGTDDAIIRVDMSEYMEKHSVSKLIGSPPGYVGYDEGGQLSEQVRRHPYSVVLFDEIEKAHPDVLNILLQVLDDGRITDSHGRITDFKNTIIIMTSNAGAGRIMEPKNLGFAAERSEKHDYKTMKDAVMEEVKHIFKPEFINRIDEVIVFAALTKENMKDIIDILFNEIAARAKSQMNITLTITDKAKDILVEKGYDVKYGARALKRKVQTEIEDRMAEEILAGRICEGDRVSITAGKDQIVFRVRK